MNWIEDTLRQFGQNIGIGDLGFNSRQLCCLALERSGVLYIERKDRVVVVYLAKEIPYIHEGVLEKALKLCHPGTLRSLPVVAGLNGSNELVFLARVKEEEFSLPTLEEAIRLVKELHESAEQC